MITDFGTSLNRRQFLKRSTATIGASVGVSSIMAACGTPTAADGRKLLTLMYTSGEIFDEYLDEFERANPDISLRLVDYDQIKLNAMFVAGSPPDFVRGAGVTDSPNFAARGLSENLEPYLAKSQILKASDLMPVNDVWRWDGKQVGKGPTYGITKDYSQDLTLWTNRELFDQAKVPYLSTTEPVSYDELLELGKRLTVRKSGRIQTYGLGIQWGTPGLILQMILQMGGRLFDDSLQRVDFTTPEALNALSWQIKFAEAHVGPSPLDPNPDGWDGPTFAAGRMAITQNGYWFGGQISNGTPESRWPYCFACPAPLMGPQRISGCYFAVGAWIPVQSHYKEEAWRFMEYFMAQKPALDRAQSGWGLPVLKSLQDDFPSDKPHTKQAAEMTRQELKYLRVVQYSPYLQFSSLSGSIDKYLRAILRKETTLEQAAQALTDEINRLMQENYLLVG